MKKIFLSIWKEISKCLSTIWKKFVSVKVYEKKFLSVKVYEKNFVSVKVYEKKFAKCKSVRKNLLSVKVYEKKFSKCKSVWRKFCKCLTTIWKKFPSQKENSDFFHHYV